MSSFFADLWKFLFAIIHNWAAYWTGGIIVALVTLWHTLRGKPIPRKLGIGLAAFFLLLSFFKAWRDQYQRANSLQSQLVPSNVEKAHRKAVRERLGRFIAQADTLRRTTCAYVPAPSCDPQRKRWEGKVEEYLRANLDSSYTAIFNVDKRVGIRPEVGLSIEMNTLEKFIEQLKAR